MSELIMALFHLFPYKNRTYMCEYNSLDCHPYNLLHDYQYL